MLFRSVAGAFGEGHYRWFAIAVALMLAAVVGLREASVLRTQRRLRARAEASQLGLRQGERRLASVLQSTSDSVLVVDDKWRVTFFNDKALDYLPELSIAGLGASLWDLFPSSEQNRYQDFFRTAARTERPTQLEFYHAAAAGQVEGGRQIGRASCRERV